MGSHKEFEGRSVKDALKQAGLYFDVNSHELEYKVIRQGASGIFGLVGARKAKISVTLPVKPTQPVSETNQPVDPSKDKADSPSDGTADAIDLDVALERGEEFLTALAEKITGDVSIEQTVGPQKVKLNLGGTNPAMLIGRRGETLEALQYLTEKVTNKGLPKRIRVQLDVEGYMQNRRNNIRNLSLRLAEKAKRKKRPVTVGQMPPHERRLVHVTLRNESGVRTQSVGAGYIRKIMIFPEAGQTNRRRKPRPRSSR